jgi:hypothetical protein
LATHWTIGSARPKKARIISLASAMAGSRVFQRQVIVRKKKPVDPVRQAEKNRAHRIGWAIALAGIVVGFILVLTKPA